jgi:4-nitrophenyl phosphatase
VPHPWLKSLLNFLAFLATLAVQRFAAAQLLHYTCPVPFDFSPFRAVLVDLDGTVYHEDEPILGAIEFLRRLKREGRNFACLTNSTSSPQRVGQRLQKMGIALDLSQVYTAGAATVDYVLEQSHARHPNRRARVFNLATEGVQEMLEGKVDWAQTESDPCDAVIIGTPTGDFASEPRQRLALVLLRKGAAAVAICSDRIYPSPRGLEFGAGAFAAMLCYASGAAPVYCGKPQEIFFQELCHRLSVAPADCLLIGDNLESDVMGAKRLGMKTLLTLTGVAQRADLNSLAREFQPDWVVEDLRELA